MIERRDADVEIGQKGDERESQEEGNEHHADNAVPGSDA
jgi:hypothetical protein